MNETNNHIKRHLTIARSLADLMDNKFNLFGFRFGLDPILGIIPGGGDTVTFLISLYMVWIAVQMRVPQDKIAHMIFHVVFDFLVGLVPVLGDIGDFMLKSNIRNYKILEEFHRPEVIEGEIVEEKYSD